MEEKKSRKADLEKKRVWFIQIGFVFVLSVLLLIFEWRMDSKGDSGKQQGTVVAIDMEIAVLPTEDHFVPPPPQPHLYQKVRLVAKTESGEEIRIYDSKTLEELIVEPQNRTGEEVAVLLKVSESLPQFPGGNQALKQFIATNLNYPKSLQSQNVQGKVYVRFLVTAQGQVQKVTVLRKIYPALDAEAVRVIRSLPEWIPAYKGGSPVAMWQTLPVTFMIR